MAISLSDENLVTLAEAAGHLPGRIHKATVWRWATTGVKHGIVLDSLMLGGIRYTSIEALQRFCNASTAAADAHHAPKRSVKERERAIRAAERRLESLGI